MNAQNRILIAFMVFPPFASPQAALAIALAESVLTYAVDAHQNDGADDECDAAGGGHVGGGPDQ